MHICSISRWPVEGLVAERFSVGRVFLVGDSAHRHPPSGALGLNTGIQDSHNLTWKLAAVLRGAAGPALLDSYEAERRPVAERVVERSLFALFNQIAMTAGTGVVAGARFEWNRAQLTALFADTADGKLRRTLLAEYFDTNRITTAHLGLEMGYDYADAGYVYGDGTEAPEADPLGLLYQQTARPGHRMPHAWLWRNGSRVGTHSLLKPGAFLLLSDAHGRDWVDAAEQLAVEYHVDIEHAVIGSDLSDPSGDWTRRRGHAQGGAVLVRPDGFVAARSGPLSHPRKLLERGIVAALGLPPV